MAETGYVKLNEGQRDCLRLVLAHLNSKEISRKLDISPHTVDQRLRGAMRLLDTNTRFEAARKFAEYEGEETYQPLIYQSPDIEKLAEPTSLKTPTEREKEAGQNKVTDRVKPEQLSPALAIGATAIRQRRLPFPRHRGEKNRLSTVERLVWVILIAIGSAISFGGILAGLEALSRLKGV